jgi:hypothetical protein
MQFIPRGPDIPDSLVQAHEDGRVVFFCGAGISYPAGLPGFSGLVQGLYTDLGMTPNEVQAEALRKNQYDTAISLLETDYTGGRFAVRSQLREILTADTKAPGALDTHKALLTLAGSKSGRIRLITTNFDRLFEHCLSAASSSISSFSAPLLPVPKSQWNGLVYLHGVLPADDTNLEFELNKLILSSGDFGRAYLTERWAARFLSDLFRNYVVCFVGYSIDDPILRYMMDALAADRLLGERTIEAYAFGGCTPKKQDQVFQQWRAKGVTPILYHIKKREHALLHRTLHAWSATYRDGANGKESLIVQFAPLKPAKSTAQDNYVGRVLWALAEPLGLAAKRFAELTPSPPLDWLDVFCEARFRHADLLRFGVTPNGEEDRRLEFSLESRPTPYSLAPRMSLLHQGAGDWDPIMAQIARWLLAHLEDPKLFLWVALRGDLHPRFAAALALHLRTNPIAEVPATFWQLMLADRVRARSTFSHEIYAWVARFKQERRLSLAMRMSLRDILSPCVAVRPPFDFAQFVGEAAKAKTLRAKDFVNWEITLGSEYVHHALKELDKDEGWQNVLRELLSDLTSLLKDTLDLKAELKGANARSDLSYIAQPSIAKHSQNQDLYDWTALIVLTRDSWEAVLEKEAAKALAEVERWKRIEYPLFRRLVFFALSSSELYTQAQRLDALLMDDGYWLWSSEAKNEAITLLTLVATSLSEGETERLEAAVLTGPPLTLFRDDVDPDLLQRAIDVEILEKLLILSEHRALHATAAVRLSELSAKYPDFKTTEESRFPVWMGPVTSLETPATLPEAREALAQWLIDHAADHAGDWFSRCQRDFGRSATTLMLLAKRGEWSVPRRWDQALQAWSTEPFVKRSWRLLSPALGAAPRGFIEEIQGSLSWWLESAGKVLTTGGAQFLRLIETSLDIQESKISASPKKVSDALQQPPGRIAQALFNWWYRQNLQDDQGLSKDMRSVLTRMLDTRIQNYQHGRLIGAANVLTLFRVDPAWTQEHVLSLFDWSRDPIEALAAWQGFLWAPRAYPPLIMKLKPQLLATADHCEALGDAVLHYASFLTFVALEMHSELSATELAKATHKLPIKGLVQALRTLRETLVAAADRREAYWDNRTSRYMRYVWPKDKKLAADANISNAMAELLLATDSKFPQAMAQLEGWLTTAGYPYSLIPTLRESKLCERFPKEALNFLSKIIGKQTVGVALSPDFGACLDAIAKEAALTDDPRLQRMREIQRLSS